MALVTCVSLLTKKDFYSSREEHGVVVAVVARRMTLSFIVLHIHLCNMHLQII